MDFSKLKLVIWDLDDTFWTGTLSEGGILPIERNISLVKSLTDRGIVNSICSKNDFQSVEVQLSEIGLWDYFVFPSVDWNPKGERISSLLKDMGLQAEHTLFVDDNLINLNEAKHYSPTLNTALPGILEDLETWVQSVPVSDINHKRLNNYRVLQAKQHAKNKSVDNLDFLFESKTRVEICHDCLNEIDRLLELVNRTNQLNFTKIRSSKEKLIAVIEDPSVEAGYVKVADRYGDYGVVGFYAMCNGELIHFLFSCRTIGQGVEQYVYSYLNYPKLNVNGKVVNMVTKDKAPAWINQDVNSNKDDCIRSSHKVVVKGGCDFKSMTSYFKTTNLVEEFTYVGKKGNNIELISHSTNYLEFPFLTERQKKILLDDCLFADEDMFNTSMYDGDVEIVFLSTLIDANLGIYRHKQYGLLIAFGEYLYPLTDPNNWNLYVDGKVFTGDNVFTIEYLQEFSDKYDFIGHLSPEQIVDNARKVLQRVSPKAKVCYLLGSEVPFLKNTQKNYEGREGVYRQINTLFRDLARKNDRVLLIDFNDFIHGQTDFNDNINHFVRRVYYEAACRANEYILSVTGESVRQRSKLSMWFYSVIDIIGRTGFYQTRFYLYIRKPYVLLKRLLSI
ncbi:MAG: hypothetical protein PUD22_10965 [Erysipelotrichaceae bacterium]|nr:hypothetical protein [Erysipelotrichaceae bacterium]